jgi:hypothetical protein
MAAVCRACIRDARFNIGANGVIVITFIDESEVGHQLPVSETAPPSRRRSTHVREDLLL